MGKDPEALRAFLAVPINEEVRNRLVAWQDRLKSCGARVSWTRPENIHLTMAFLGDVSMHRIQRLTKRLDPPVAALPPFSFEVGSLGFFGSARSPRVLWAGVAGADQALQALYEAVCKSLHATGFTVEDRPFKPHLTLGRVRSRRGVGELTSALASAKNNHFGWVEVDRLHLMRSQLQPQGAHYSILHTSLLGGAQTHGHKDS